MSWTRQAPAPCSPRVLRGLGEGWGGLVKLFAQNQRLFPVGDQLSEVIRVAGLQLAK